MVGNPAESGTVLRVCAAVVVLLLGGCVSPPKVVDFPELNIVLKKVSPAALNDRCPTAKTCCCINCPPFNDDGKRKEIWVSWGQEACFPHEFCHALYGDPGHVSTCRMYGPYDWRHL